MKPNMKQLIGSAVLAGLLFAAASSHAADIRSWDQKIDSVSKRFVLLAAFTNEAVLDKETQLVWQREPSTATSDWAIANLRCGELSLGGRYGWRLPTDSELMSLLDPAAPGNDKLPAGHPFVGSLQDYFWSSRLYPGSPDYAIIVSAANADYTGFVRDNPNIRAWCVRGPAAQ
jgi:hypothetical protein